MHNNNDYGKGTTGNKWLRVLLIGGVAILFLYSIFKGHEAYQARKQAAELSAVKERLWVLLGEFATQLGELNQKLESEDDPDMRQKIQQEITDLHREFNNDSGQILREYETKFSGKK